MSNIIQKDACNRFKLNKFLSVSKASVLIAIAIYVSICIKLLLWNDNLWVCTHDNLCYVKENEDVHYKDLHGYHN